VIVRNCNVDSGKRFVNDWFNEDPSEGIFIQKANHWEIYNNTVKDWCHTCIGISGAEGAVTYNEIHNNYVTCEHVDYGRPFGCGGGTTDCSHNKFYNNYVYNCGTRSQIGGQYTEFCYNIIDTITNDRTSYFSDRAQGLNISTYDTTINKNNKFCNNVFYKCDEAGIFVRAYGEGDLFKIENNTIANNIVMNCGIDSGSNQTNLGIKVDDHGNIGSNIYKNNSVYNTNGQTNVFFYPSVGAVTASIFNSKNGMNGDTITSNISQDAKFANPANKDFSLLSGSPCIDAGISVGLTADYAGRTVPRGSLPDIGALENETGSPGPTKPQNFRVIK
jgi:hypothetical protein